MHLICTISHHLISVNVYGVILIVQKQTSVMTKSNLFFFTLSFIFTSFREQDEAYINSLRWSALVGLEPAYTRM